MLKSLTCVKEFLLYPLDNDKSDFLSKGGEAWWGGSQVI